MASLSIDNYRKTAEVCHGDAVCRKKLTEMLEELRLPKGLLPLEDIQEFGYDRATGFIWITQKKKKEHTFKKIKQQVSYAAELTAFVEPQRMKKVTGVKAKQLLLWLTIVEMYLDTPTSENLTFKSSTGLSGCNPVSAFELDQ